MSSACESADLLGTIAQVDLTPHLARTTQYAFFTYPRVIPTMLAFSCFGLYLYIPVLALEYHGELE